MTTATELEIRTHGVAAYKRGCRCEVCKEAKRAQNAAYQRKRRGPDLDVISKYEFEVSCLNCGGPVAHVTSGVPCDGQTRTQAMCKCTKNGCGREWLVTTIMRPAQEEEVSS